MEIPDDFEYGNLGPELSRAILTTYVANPSYERTSHEHPVSPAHISRLVQHARDRDIIDPSFRGTKRIPREPILEFHKSHPNASIPQIARLRGVSESTVRRVLRGQ